MSAGHVSGTLDALADRLLCWLVTPREFSYVLGGLSLSPCSPCAARQIYKGLGRSGQARRGCVPGCLSRRWKGNSSE
jgi:hypothetical protein